MKRRLVFLSLSALVLSGCERIDQWFGQDDLPVIQIELTEEQLEQFDPNEYSDFQGTIEVKIVDEQVDETDQAEEPPLSEEEKQQQELLESLPTDAHPDDWNLLLVNNNHALPEDFEVELEEVDNEQLIDARIVEAWNQWRNDAIEAGHQLFFASGYRSVERQTNNYENRIQGYVNDGYTEEEARELTEEYIAVPGYSEHHTGLALDIVDQEWIAQGNSLSPDYDTQESQQWLVETMADYGFILRYPEGKEEITGINYESWHFRYVGVENAQFMVEHELVLEEYMELLHEREAMTNEESLEDESEGNNYDIEDVETPDEEE